MSAKPSHDNGLKLVIIGAGSSYTPEILEGILKRASELMVTQISLYDVPSGSDHANTILTLSKRMIDRMSLETNLDVHSRPQINLTFHLEEALQNADFVFTQFRVGGLEARALDESLPLKYGFLGQETTGIGGLFKGLRTIPVVLNIAKTMERLCPDAWLINFTNPSGMVTEAVLQQTKIKCIGLCNVPINMIADLSKQLDVAPEQLFCRFTGLNHLSYITEVSYKGKDQLPNLIEQAEAFGHLMANIPEVGDRKLLIQTLGCIPSVYLSYYYFHDHMVAWEQSEVAEGKGTRATQVMAVQKDLFEIYANVDLNEKPMELEKRGGSLYSEAAVQLMASIVTDRRDVQVLNVLNRGAIPGLPDDAVVETNCLVTASGPIPLSGSPLPAHGLGLVQAVKQYELLVIESVIKKDLNIARQALLAHPLCKDADKALLLFDELVQAHRVYLDYFEN